MRYGSIRYANNLPVDHALVSGAIPRPDGLDISQDTPAALNAAIDAGTVDVAAVSAARLLAPHDGLQVLPEATIASHGPVDSVLLIAKRAIADLDDATIAVSDESATGALLLRILLERDVGVHPRYEVRPSGLDGMLETHDAALLIGDDALRATADPHATDDLHVFDLGEAWRAFTGHPMVYALWVARPGLDASALAAFRSALSASREWGAAHLDTLIGLAHERTGVPRETLATYYDRLTYQLGDAETAGLHRFAAEVAQLGTAPGGVQPLPPVLEAIA